MPSLFESVMGKAYLEQNPNSFIARSVGGRIVQDSRNNPDLAGSNNAGGLMPSVTPTQPVGVRGSFGGMIRNTQQGIFSNAGGNNAINTMPQYMYPDTNNNNGDMFGRTPISFAAGGMLDEEGRPVRPGEIMRPPSAGTGRTLPSARFKVEAQPPGMMPTGGPALGAASPAPMDSAQIEQEAQRFVKQHPEEVQKIQNVIALAMQTGELTPDELNTAVQLAKTALASPQSYPQIREFAIKNGLGTEQDIPQQMDQGLLYVLIVAGKSLQPGGNAMQNQAPSPTQQPKQSGVIPEYSDGGMTGDKTHIAKLHPREYVIPEDALIYHGKKHFDKLVEQARTPPDATN